jgi:hypothetical protein
VELVVLEVGAAEVLAVDVSVSFTVVKTTSFVVGDMEEDSIVPCLAVDDAGSIDDTDSIVEGSLPTTCTVVPLGAEFASAEILIDGDVPTVSELRK